MGQRRMGWLGSGLTSSAGGVGGLFERLVAPRVLRRLYAEEL
jgi:hypothetical protein